MSLYTANAKGSFNQDNELWISMARHAYPMLSVEQCRSLRDEAVMEWALDMPTEKAKLYKQYYTFKTIKNS